MGLFNKIKDSLSGNSSDTVKEVTSDAVEAVTDTVNKTADEPLKLQK